MAQTPNQLAIASACFQCMDERTLQLIQLYLLNQILANGVGSGGVTSIVAGTNVTISPVGGTGAVTINASGGSSGTFAGAGSPQSAQVGSPGNTYLDTSGNHFWVKATGVATNTGWALIVN